MTEALTDMAMTILLSFLSLLSAYAVMYIKKIKAKAEKEIEKIDGQKEKEIFNRAAETVDRLAEQTVAALEQTGAKELRKLVKDGGADRESLLAFGRKAAVSVYCQLKPEYIGALEAGINDVMQYITDRVEAEVLNLKKAE